MNPVQREEDNCKCKHFPFDIMVNVLLLNCIRFFLLYFFRNVLVTTFNRVDVDPFHLFIQLVFLFVWF